jgi:ribA/ribD-fused uncharacterized protein
MIKNANIILMSNTNNYAKLLNCYNGYFKDHKGTLYRSVDQYYIKKKQEFFEPRNYHSALFIMNNYHSEDLYRYSNVMNNYNDNIWREKRYTIMMQGLELKFTQNEYLFTRLKNTKDKFLVYCTPNDMTWGNGFCENKSMDSSNWPGENLLGCALMETRRNIC